MLSTVLQIVGMVVVAAGLALMYPPAGVAALGAGLLLFGLALERD
jgi:hypothetical protein